MTRELLGRVSKASQELFGQNAGLRALRMFETKTEELLRPESSWDERNPCQRARVAELRTGLIRVQTVLEFSVKWRIMNRLHDQIMTHIQLTGIPRRSAQASRARFSRTQSRIACRGAESRTALRWAPEMPPTVPSVSLQLSARCSRKFIMFWATYRSIQNYNTV